MEQRLLSDSLGVLIKEEEGIWISKLIPIPFFNNIELPITYLGYYPERNDGYLKWADTAIINFLTKTNTDRLVLSQPLYDFCKKASSGIIKPVKLSNTQKIWQHITPCEIHVSKKYDDYEIRLYICIHCFYDLGDQRAITLAFEEGEVFKEISFKE